MAELKYQCLIYDKRDRERCETFEEKIVPGEWGLKICEDAYKTEMALKTKLDESCFHIEPGLTCIAMSEDRKILGFVAIYVDKEAKDLIIGHAYVRPEFRKKGVYKLMLERVNVFAQVTKMKRLVSFVYRSNGESMKTHHALGFKQELVGYTKEVKDG